MDKCNKKFEKLTNVHIQKYKNKTYAEHIYMFKYTDIRREILEYKFDDKAYYTKQFKRIVGTTPTNYRKQQQINKI